MADYIVVPKKNAENISEASGKYEVVPKENLDTPVPNAIQGNTILSNESFPRPSIKDYYRHYIGRFIPGGLSVAGGMLTSELGPLGTAAGAGLGSTIGAELQNELPEMFGEGPQSTGELLTRILGDAAFQGILPPASRAAGPASAKIARKFSPAVKSGIAREEARQLSRSSLYPESQVLDTAAENSQNLRQNLIGRISDARLKTATTGTDYVSTAQQNFNNLFNDNPIAEKLIRLDQTTGKAKEQLYKEITQETLKDVQNVRNFKLATGGQTEVRQLALNDILTRNYNGSTKTFNPSKILDELRGPKGEIFEEALGKNGFENLENFVRTMTETESKGSLQNVINYTRNRALFTIPSALMGGSLGGVPGAVAAAGASILIDSTVLARLMENPNIAKAVTTAAKTPLSEAKSTFLSQVLLNGIRGTNVLVQAPGDKLIEAQVTEDGKVVPRN